MTVKLVVVPIAIVSLLMLEYKFPFFAYQNSLRSRITNNFELGIVNSIASSLFAIAIARFIPLDRSAPGIFTTISSPVIAGILAFLVLDLYMYCWHRLMHIVPLAWRFHRVHHTDRTMNVSTAYRFHAIEIISSSMPKLALIWWLGIASNWVLGYELVFTLIVALHHSNLRLPAAIDRLLAFVILTPNYHRIHHSQIVAETNSNYSSVLSWWDRLFGTYRSRLDVENIQLGVSDEDRELNIWQSIALPILPSVDRGTER
ncbi:sterol desaturase family protein [Chamaesiphon sp.]|uniref:sterol desaturase family protein n=1 Tax=Chamaesiphon sp. TaxID=2814140 RepID=UPI00359445DF